MLCQNCGKNEVSFKYTQVINGVRKEMELCDKCAKELGLKGIDFSIPINFSSFLSDFFDNSVDNFLPSFSKTGVIKCEKCGMSFEDFANTGEFGCGNCYVTFANRIVPLLKNLHGSSQHIGREYKENIDELEYNKNKFEKSQKQKTESPKEKLQKDLQRAINDERYEDAAKIRDEIKKMDKGE